MDEKLKKALRTSKQGVWLLLVLCIILNAIAIYGVMQEGTSLVFSYLQTNLASLIQIGALITALVMYKKEKYTTGAEIVQWTGLGSIIVNFALVVVGYVLTGEFTIDIAALLTGMVIPVILIIEALKVIRLADIGENRQSKVPLIAISIIALVIIADTLMLVKIKNDIEDAWDKIKDEIQSGIVDNNENKEDNNNEEQNKQDENEDVKDDDENKDNEEEIDPYKNYNDIKWSDETVTTHKGHKITVKENKLYINNIKVLSSLNVEKVEVHIQTMSLDPDDEGYPVLTILTTDGKVYESHLLHLNNNFSNIEIKEIMAKYKIIDMTYIDNYTNEYIYYLTEDGKLIDENGVSYDKYNFVSTLRGTGLSMPITFDKDYNGYYYNSKNNTYTVIVSKSTGAKLAFSKVYEVEDGEKLLIQTAYNKLFEYDGKSNKAVQVGETVKSVNALGENSRKIIITFTDGTTKIYDNVGIGWNVKKDEAIQSYKVFNPYANYKNMTWNATDIINSGSISYKIENGIVNYYNSGKRTKVTGITGTAKKMYLAKNTGGAFSCYVLVDEGVIYNIYDFQKTATKVVNLSKYNIIDITEINNYTNETIYYLTADGKLIDKNGVSYDKYGFVDQYTMGRPSGGWSIDKNGYVYSYNEISKQYEQIADKANYAKLIISKIYTVYSENENEPGYNNIILTTDNKVFTCNEYSNKATQITGNASKVLSMIKGEELYLIIVFTDGKIMRFSGLSAGYDVKAKKDIDVDNSLQKFSCDSIRGITVRKNGYNTSYYQLNEAQIIEFYTYLQIAEKNNKEIEDLSKYEYWIGIGTGDTKSLVRTFDNNLIDYDNAAFYSEYLVDYIASITKNVEWK